MTGRCPFAPGSNQPGATRRGMLTTAMGLAGAALARPAAAADPAPGQPPLIKTETLPNDRLLPFHGLHQNGIVTPMQGHTYFAAFDLLATTKAEVAKLMQTWTAAAEQLTQGRPIGPNLDNPDQIPSDSGDVRDLPPSRLTLTFGFGAGLFEKDGADRYGLAQHRPAAFVDLPRFPGDQLVPERTGGDLSVQACADDPQATMHAVRQLMRLADGVAVVRWVQTGFLPGYDPKVTPRNLMGFKDGTANLPIEDPAAQARHLWVGDEAAPWMRGGTYAVARPIRIALEKWDRMTLSFQEKTIGRHKASGAGLGITNEFAPIDLEANDEDGNPIIAENAHVRLAAPQSNDGAQILRRGYSYDNGVAVIAERWPPWHRAMVLDAGLLFICYQRDPTEGFIKIFEQMSRFDMLNQFVTPIGGGLFAIPPGPIPNRYLAQDLFANT